MFTNEQLFKETSKDIRYISIVGNSECVGEALAKHLAKDFQTCNKSNGLLTILVVDTPHVFNIAVEQGIPIAEIEQHRDKLEPLVKQVFYDWWNNSEKYLLDLLARYYKHRATNFEIKLTGSTVEQHIEEFNALLLKLNIQAEIVRWDEWLTHTAHVEKITQQHSELLTNNSEYLKGYDRTAKLFGERKLLKQQKSSSANKKSMEALPNNEQATIAEKKYYEGSMAYLSTEAPLTLEIAKNAGYRKIKYAGSEPEAFVVTRQFLLKDPTAVTWDDTLNTTQKSITLNINNKINIEKITGYSKKFPDFLRREEMFVSLLALLLKKAITKSFMYSSTQRFYIKALVGEIKNKTANTKSIQGDAVEPEEIVSIALAHRCHDDSFSKLSLKKASNFDNHEMLAVLLKNDKEAQANAVDSLTTDKKSTQLSEIAIEQELAKIIQALKKSFNTSKKKTQKLAKVFNNEKELKGLIENGKQVFQEFFSLNISYSDDPTIQIRALTNCLQQIINKIYKTATPAEQNQLLAKLAADLQSDTIIVPAMDITTQTSTETKDSKLEPEQGDTEDSSQDKKTSGSKLKKYFEFFQKNPKDKDTISQGNTLAALPRNSC